MFQNPPNMFNNATYYKPEPLDELSYHMTSDSQSGVHEVSPPPTLNGVAIDINSIHSLDDIQLDDFETAYNMLTQLQAKYVQSQIELLQLMQQQNLALQKTKSTNALAKMHGYLMGALFDNKVYPESIPRPDNPIPVPSHELLSENENSALQGFLDDFLIEESRDPKDEFDKLINGLDYQKHDNYLEPPLLHPDEQLQFDSQLKLFEDSDGDLAEAAKIKRRSRKKLLSEKEKRENHTTSEKKRRLLIKDSFDNLVDKLTFSGMKSKSKAAKASTAAKMSKFVVLDAAGNEIEKLLQLNQQLKGLCTNNGVKYQASKPTATVS